MTWDYGEHRRAEAAIPREVAEAFYQRVFGDALGTVGPSIRHRDRQVAGIDRHIQVEGRRLGVEEKWRSKDYGDVLIEVWSDNERRVPGWAFKPLDCDLFAYIYPGGGVVCTWPRFLAFVAETLRNAHEALLRAHWLGWPEVWTSSRHGDREWWTGSVVVPWERFLEMTGGILA